MYFTGIDMGSTCTKLIALDEGGAIAYKKVVPTGWNCVETAKGLIDELAKEGFIKGVAPVHIGFMGGGGNIEKFTHETGPAIAKRLKDEGVDAVLMTAG